VELISQRLDSRSHIVESALHVATINGNIFKLSTKTSQRVIEVTPRLRRSVNLPIKTNKRITQRLHRILGPGRRLDKLINSFRSVTHRTLSILRRKPEKLHH